MNKAELIDAIAGANAIPKTEATRIFDSTVAILTDALVRGETVQLPGFGSFKVQARPARTARNPRTGETVAVPETQVAKFTPALALKKAVAPATT